MSTQQYALLGFTMQTSDADYVMVPVLIIANGADYPLALSRPPMPLVQVGLALFLGKSSSKQVTSKKRTHPTVHSSLPSPTAD
jgi:hypothetical protein